jgi:hypothetical protein
MPIGTIRVGTIEKVNDSSGKPKKITILCLPHSHTTVEVALRGNARVDCTTSTRPTDRRSITQNRGQVGEAMSNTSQPIRLLN